jgi:phosphopantetheinyl transferase
LIKVFKIAKGLQIGLLNLNLYASTSINATNKREIETKGSQFLINHLLNINSNLIYNKNGKPQLSDDSRHISISHSHEKLVVIINDHEQTGIDIEKIRIKILNIKAKFLIDSELREAEDDIEKLIIYWGAKESLYKIYGIKTIDYKHNLQIQPFIKLDSGTLIGTIHLYNTIKTFEINYLKIEDYMLVYISKEINKC